MSRCVARARSSLPLVPRDSRRSRGRDRAAPPSSGRELGRLKNDYRPAALGVHCLARVQLHAGLTILAAQSGVRAGAGSTAAA